jgi:hypothetical protein
MASVLFLGRSRIKTATSNLGDLGDAAGADRTCATGAPYCLPFAPLICVPSRGSTAARTLGLELHMLNASSESDFDAVFSKVRQLRASGLVISAGTAIFASRSGQLAALAAKHAVPTVSSSSAFTAAGGFGQLWCRHR